jgi:hypothetical protein
MALPVPTARALPEARFIQVRGDQMEPTLTQRDFVAVVPVSEFIRDSVYVVADAFGTPIVQRCQWLPACGLEPGSVMIFGDRPGSVKALVTREQFREMVLGIVAAHIKVTNPDLLDLMRH